MVQCLFLNPAFYLIIGYSGVSGIVVIDLD